MHDAAQDASPSNRHATAPELPIWLHFRGPKKVFSRLRGQYLVEGEHVTYIVNRLNEYVPSHFLKFSSSRAVAFARARLLSLQKRGGASGMKTRFLSYNPQKNCSG